MKMKNIILDVDGTLWNTTEVVAQAWNRAIEQDGRSSARVDGARLRTLFGKPMNVIANAVFTDVSKETCAQLLVACCAAEQETLWRYEGDLMYPHVKETLSALRERGKTLFIVSNCQSGYIELFMEKNGLSDEITDFECFGNTGLLKDENIGLLLKRNGLKKEESVYVGDTQGDCDAAHAAGVSFLFASYGFGQVAKGSAIEDFAALLDYPFR